MSEHIIWHTKPCSVPGHCLLIGPPTDLHAFSVQMPIETAELIVRACNCHKTLLDACEISEICFRKLADIGTLGTSKHVLLDNANMIKSVIAKANKEN